MTICQKDENRPFIFLGFRGKVATSKYLTRLCQLFHACHVVPVPVTPTRNSSQLRYTRRGGGGPAWGTTATASQTWSGSSWGRDTSSTVVHLATSLAVHGLHFNFFQYISYIPWLHLCGTLAAFLAVHWLHLHYLQCTYCITFSILARYIPYSTYIDYNYSALATLLTKHWLHSLYCSTLATSLKLHWLHFVQRIGYIPGSTLTSCCTLATLATSCAMATIKN